MATIARANKEIRTLALSLPEAWEDHPWGDDVVKVRKKIFVFLGPPGRRFGLGVKLDRSLGHARTLAFVKPVGYGLGRAGWVGIQIDRGDVPLELLRDWVLESYELIAPKKLAAAISEASVVRAVREPRKRAATRARTPGRRG